MSQNEPNKYFKNNFRFEGCEKTHFQSKLKTYLEIKDFQLVYTVQVIINYLQGSNWKSTLNL